MSRYKSRPSWIGYGRRGRVRPSIAIGEDRFLDNAVRIFMRRFMDESFQHFARRNRQDTTDILTQLGESLALDEDRLELSDVLIRQFGFKTFDLRIRRTLEREEDMLEDDSGDALINHQRHLLADALKEDTGKILYPLCRTESASKNRVWLDLLVKKALSDAGDGMEGGSSEALEQSDFEHRLTDLVESLGLSSLERELVIVLYCAKVSSDLPLMASLNEIFSECNFKTNLHTFLGCNRSEVSEILSNTSLLRKCHVISSSPFDSQFELEDRIAEFLAGFNGPSFLGAVLERVDTKVTDCDLKDVSIPQNQVDLLLRILNSESPAQILLYGLPGHGKTTLAVAAAKAVGRELYQIADREEMKPSEIIAAIKQASIVLKNRRDVILVVDEADRVLCTDNAWIDFGERSDKAWLNNLMDNSSGPSFIWITNQTRGIASSVNRRFDLSIGFQGINTRQRFDVWKKLLEQRSGLLAEVPEEVIWEFSARYVLAPSIIKNTIEKVAALSSSSVADVISLFREFLDSASELSGRTDRRGKQQVLLPRANYSLDGLNVDVDPAGIIESVKSLFKYLEENPDDRRGAQLNLLLVGPPGTGKTEIVKHIAKTVDRDVIVKKASDLLSPYVGMNEQNIAQAFKEAEAANAILFIDEVDSFIQDRAAAVRSWESTMVNEMLQQMESFRGVLICATNNDQSLDGAAFRRFSVKVRFGYLKEEGRKIFWQKFFPEVAVTDDVLRVLCTMNCLAPGDFHAVANRFRFQNGVSPSADDILKALESEVAFKVRKTGREIGYR